MLQWLLLLIGIAIVVAVYVYTRYYQQRDAQSQQGARSKTPHIGHSGEGQPAERSDAYKQTLGQPPGQASGQTPGQASGPAGEAQEAKLGETIFGLNILAPKQTEWSGDQIMRCAIAAKLRCGENQIFAYHPSQEEDSKPLFYLANYIEPGTFDWDNMSVFKTQGLTLIMRLPLEHAEQQDHAVHSAKDALNQLLACAQQMSEVLGGTLCNSERQPLEKEQVKDMYATCKQYDTQA